MNASGVGAKRATIFEWWRAVGRAGALDEARWPVEAGVHQLKTADQTPRPEDIDQHQDEEAEGDDQGGRTWARRDRGRAAVAARAHGHATDEDRDSGDEHHNDQRDDQGFAHPDPSLLTLDECSKDGETCPTTTQRRVFVFEA